MVRSLNVKVNLNYAWKRHYFLEYSSLFFILENFNSCSQSMCFILSYINHYSSSASNASGRCNIRHIARIRSIRRPMLQNAMYWKTNFVQYARFSMRRPMLQNAMFSKTNFAHYARCYIAVKAKIRSFKKATFSKQRKGLSTWLL